MEPEPELEPEPDAAAMSRAESSLALEAGARRQQHFIHDPAACVTNEKLTPAFLAGPVGEWDRNGVLYDIATEGGTSEWVNPHLAGRVVAAWSSQEFVGRSCPETFVSSPSEQPKWSVTKDLVNSWVRVDLGSLRRLRVAHYALRTESWGGGVVGNRDLRSWQLQGSAHEDGPWVMLRRHENDDTLDRQKCPVASWPVENAGAWRYLRVLQTGLNAHGNKQLSCSGVEFWGVLSTLDDTLVSALEEQRKACMDVLQQWSVPSSTDSPRASVTGLVRSVMHGGLGGVQRWTRDIAEAQPEELEATVRNYPAAAKVKNERCELPLHTALRLLDATQESSADTLVLLLRAFPDAAREREMLGRLPLHLAVRPAIQMVERFLGKCTLGPPGTLWPTRFLRALIEAYPAAVQKPDINGQSCLANAVSSRAPAETVQLLFANHPQAAEYSQDVSAQRATACGSCIDHYLLSLDDERDGPRVVAVAAKGRSLADKPSLFLFRAYCCLPARFKLFVFHESGIYRTISCPLSWCTIV
jgi:hypothetical protein